MHSPHRPGVTGKTSIAIVLKRRSLNKLADVALVRDIPRGTIVLRGVEKFALQRGDGSIDDPFALAGDAG
jgi:hypothetical protein